MKKVERITFKLYPTEEQKQIMLLNCNNARFAYNWGVARLKEIVENEHRYPTKYDLATEFAKFKKQPGFEWLNQKPASQRATKLAITNSLGMSLSKHAKKQNNFPAFHSKRNARMSYFSHEGTTVYEHDRVRLENLGWVKCRNNLPLDDENVRLCAPVIIFTGDYFELSCCIKYKTPVKPKYHFSDVDIHHEPIGIDIGVHHFAVTSDGDFYDNPNEKVNKLDKRINKISRRIDKIRQMQKINDLDTCDTKAKYPGYKSQNLLKLESKRRKLYQKHTNIRKNARCQAVADIIKKQPSAIVIEGITNPMESWGVKGAHKLNHMIANAAAGDFIERIKYKCEWNDIPLIIAHEHYPSSKMCSCCGNRLDNQLTKDRMFVCSNCGYTIDRDLNAAFNLKNLAYKEFDNIDEINFDIA